MSRLCLAGAVLLTGLAALGTGAGVAPLAEPPLGAVSLASAVALLLLVGFQAHELATNATPSASAPLLARSAAARAGEPSKAAPARALGGRERRARRRRRGGLAPDASGRARLTLW